MTMETTPTTAVDGRGSLVKGAAIGLATILGGHAVMWSILPGLQSMAAALAFLIAPWIALIALVVHFLRRREGRTAGGLGVAAAIVVGVVLLAFGFIVVIFSQGPLH